MSCTNCGTAGGGKPGGCKSNGGCSTGGCNRMNAHDWLRNLPIADMDSSCKVVEVSFNNGSRKDFFRNITLQQLEKGDLISVEGVSGFDVGEVSLTGEIVRLQMKKRGAKEENPEMKKVLRRASDRDIDVWKQNKAREPEAVIRSRAITKQLRLDMKISQVEMQADGRKATFFYIAEGRVDFRELIKVYASEFKVKVEMRQIGARQEAGKVGGIGSCGRELCCSTWLTDFKSVNTTAARYQNLSINQSKLSGQCGRLKCCLNYELDTYLDALQFFPDNCETIQVAKGNAVLIKKDIFKNLMWYTLPDSNKQYPVPIERVKKIKSQNQQGIIPDDLGAVEVTSSKPKEVEPEYVDLVGQISLQTLEKAERKRHQQNNQRQGRDQRPQQKQQGQQGNPQQRGQQQKGQQQNPNQQQRRNPNQNPNQQRPRPPFNKRDDNKR
ncbi:MAG: regulatory iron-sulfur-containing complex subunit RicT [Bacteroidota bacterium]